MSTSNTLGIGPITLCPDMCHCNYQHLHRAIRSESPTGTKFPILHSSCPILWSVWLARTSSSSQKYWRQISKYHSLSSYSLLAVLYCRSDRCPLQLGNGLRLQIHQYDQYTVTPLHYHPYGHDHQPVITENAIQMGAHCRCGSLSCWICSHGRSRLSE